MEPRLPFRLLANSFLLARPAGRNKWLPKAGVTGEREAAVIELGFKGVVLEAHSCNVAICRESHPRRRARLQVLGSLPLDSRQEAISAGISVVMSKTSPAGLGSGIQALVEPVS